MTAPEEKKKEEEREAQAGSPEQGRESKDEGHAEEARRTEEGGDEQPADDLPEDFELPQASFTSLVMMLSTTALGYLSEVEKAEPRKKSILIKLARHTVDTIQVLDEKTRGNLEKDEQELVNRVLTDLRLQCIRYAG